METVEGGCHCGAVRFRATLRSLDVIYCNCSICTMKGYLHAIVEEDDFKLLTGREALSTYTFGTDTAKHYFCGTCGVHSFYRPRSHPDRIDINVRCLDDVDLSRFNVMRFDGRDWEGHIDEIR